MLTLWIGRDPRMIINDAWVVSELLEKKSDIFSSRPRSESIHRLVLDEAAQAREALREYDGETKITMEDAALNPALE
ncbi:hypothetical protein PMAA_023340 [Talaromyces marneffei ATCC 18224]|uniref:Uncharacterized protein n=1 Tax=Talaromyces marneffei (strain ATCC 18224 / CBS 334.59 / QM 7333) TaxID=441960 RepID=B6Q5P8_TALMQ|nr:hypothetical protein PMAA_023340 [Talaromyces marneffei ATCC 18224]